MQCFQTSSLLCETFWDLTPLSFCVADASMYAHYLFNAFDTTNNGSIKFKVKRKRNRTRFLTSMCCDAFRIWVYLLFHCCQDFVMGLSILLRGTLREKLEWTFHLYDINRDGYINREVRLRSRKHMQCFTSPLMSHLEDEWSLFFPGNDWDRESHLWHDGQVHLPCTKGRRATAARGCLFPG